MHIVCQMSFLARGGARESSKAPPLAVRDSTAALGGDFKSKAERNGLSGVLDRGSSERFLDTASTSPLRGVDGRQTLFASLKEGENPRHVSGYSGHVPLLTEVAGVSFARATERALSTEAKEMLAYDVLPPDPVNNPHFVPEVVPPESAAADRLRERGIAPDRPDGSFTTATLKHLRGEREKTRVLPGYTGHVPGRGEAPVGVSYSRFSEVVFEEKGRSGKPPIDSVTARRIVNKHAILGDGLGSGRALPGEGPKRPKLVVLEKGLRLKYTTTQL